LSFKKRIFDPAVSKQRLLLGEYMSNKVNTVCEFWGIIYWNRKKEIGVSLSPIFPSVPLLYPKKKGLTINLVKPFLYMARLAGFEPATYGFVVVSKGKQFQVVTIIQRVRV